MKNIQKMVYRNVDDAFQGTVDDDLQFDDNGDLVFPEEIPEGPTQEEIDAETVKAEEEKQARIAARAIELADEARQAKTPVKEVPKVAVPTGDPDQDIIDRLRMATGDPVETFLIQREAQQRLIARNKAHDMGAESLKDQLAREFGGDDLDDREFLKTKLGRLNEETLKMVASDPQQRETLELMIEGRRAKRGREAPASPPRTEGARQAPSVAFSNTDNTEIDRFAKSFGIPRKDAELMYKASLRG